jgi:hypothetical protein
VLFQAAEMERYRQDLLISEHDQLLVLTEMEMTLNAWGLWSPLQSSAALASRANANTNIYGE